MFKFIFTEFCRFPSKISVGNAKAFKGLSQFMRLVSLCQFQWLLPVHFSLINFLLFHWCCVMLIDRPALILSCRCSSPLHWLNLIAISQSGRANANRRGRGLSWAQQLVGRPWATFITPTPANPITAFCISMATELYSLTRGGYRRNGRGKRLQVRRR